MNSMYRAVQLLRPGIMILLALAATACGRDLPGEEPLEPGDGTIVEDAPTPTL